MPLTGADAVVRMLELYGVDVIFGLCGDTSLPLYDALYCRQSKIRHILTRDERSAAYMADAYARVSGRVGICEGPSGGGATYILPGLIEANESSIPVLGITTDVSVSSRGRYTLTELDQGTLFRPLTKWNAVIDRSADIPRLIRTAFNRMTTGRPGSAHLALPFDVQNGAVDEAELWGDPELGRYPAWRVGPAPDAVESAARLLDTAQRIAIICGGGVVIAGAEQTLRTLAERVQASVSTTISGQGSIPDDHPLAVGVVGSNGGTFPTRKILSEADLVVFVGCRAGSVTTERWRFPAPGTTKIVHVDVDPGVIGANYRTDAALVGDARLALGALADAVTARPPDRALVEAIADARRVKFEAFEKLAASDDQPIKPERLIKTLQQAAPRDALVVADPGTPCPYLSAYYNWYESGRHFITNRAHGALGYSLSAAVGAHVACPGKKTIAVMGDGSFGFAVGELETVVRLKVPITFVVISNSAYGWIKAGQKTGFGGRYFSVDFSESDHAKIAAAYGVPSWRVTDPAKLDSALRAALETDGPSLIDVVTQPLQDANAPVSEWVA